MSELNLINNLDIVNSIRSDRLTPGSKFNVKNSNDTYVLIGYTSDDKILYFKESDKHYINNVLTSSDDIIDKVIYHHILC